MTALNRPAALSHSGLPSPGELFYMRVFAARTIPFGFAIGLMPFFTSGPAVAWLLFVAAVVQVLDAIIGVTRKELPQIILASVAAIVHVIVGAFILSSTNR